MPAMFKMKSDSPVALLSLDSQISAKPIRMVMTHDGPTMDKPSVNETSVITRALATSAVPAP